MKIIKPWVEIETIDGLKIMKNLERAAKQCYRTTNNITENSYKHFLSSCINRGHESVLEHEKITVRMCCDIGVYKDLTRHRFGSFSIESTRYCNYSKDKFNNELRFILPCNIDEKSSIYKEWLHIMNNVELSYLRMSNQGATPDILRMILPHSTAAELVMTANIREWRHIFSLRAQKEAHPSVQQIMIPLLLMFKQMMPELFNDISYNEEFDEDKYAKVSMVNEPDNSITMDSKDFNNYISALHKTIGEIISPINKPQTPDDVIKNNIIYLDKLSHNSYNIQNEINRQMENYTNHFNFDGGDKDE